MILQQAGCTSIRPVALFFVELRETRTERFVAELRFRRENKRESARGEFRSAIPCGCLARITTAEFACETEGQL